MTVASLVWLVDLHQVQHREPHQPASHRLYHHRPALLHRNQSKVRRTYGSASYMYTHARQADADRLLFAVTDCGRPIFQGVKSHPGSIVTS